MLNPGSLETAEREVIRAGFREIPGGSRDAFVDLSALVTRRTGLFMREQEQSSFRRKILRRMQSLGLSAAEYYLLLDHDTPRGRDEWDELAAQLTTGESYFFRDRGQMALLKERILPELIERNADRRVLRIWSAGCSSGEEPYSIAILLKELFPPLNDWQLTVIGSDLNPEAIEKGRKGLYSQWSFRMVDPRLQERYFTRKEERWEVARTIRSMVRFSQCNLVRDNYPDPAGEIRDLDLILCRNVFIYLDAPAIRAVVDKFANALGEGGYLLTGHGELRLQTLKRFSTRIIDDQVVYQKQQHLAGAAAGSSGGASAAGQRATWAPRRGGLSSVAGPTWSHAATAPEGARKPAAAQAHGRSPGPATAKFVSPAKPAPARPEPVEGHRQLSVAFSTPAPGAGEQRVGGAQGAAQVEKEERVRSLLAEMRSDLAGGRYQAVLEKGDMVISLAPEHCAVYLLLAGAQACRGEYEDAAGNCRKALEIEPTSPHPYFSLAQIAGARGDNSEAKSLLKKVIYLDADFTAAYIELADIYAAEEDAARAAKMASAAARLLGAMPSGASVHPYADVTAAELLKHVGQLLKDNGQERGRR